VFLTEIYFTTWITAVSLLCILTLIFLIYIFILLNDRKIIEKNNLLITQEKKFLSHIIHLSETERKSISRDLHDNVGMLISVLKLKIDSEIENLTENKINTTALISCDVLINKIYKSIKDISITLSPFSLINSSLIERCQYLAQEINQTGIHKIQIKRLNWLESDSKLNEQICFIIKELINNSIKHGGAKNSEIIFDQNTNNKIIMLKSDVKGPFDKEIKAIMESQSSNGLKNIFGRLILINGKISFNNDFNNRSEITIYFDK